MNKRVSDVLAKRAAGEKGFTLIELLVVVIIMGILAAVAIPVFLNMREGAWKSSVESDVTNAVLAVEQAATASNGSLLTVTADAGPVAAPGPVNLSVDGEVVAEATISEGNDLTIEIVPGGQTYIITGSNENITTGDSVYMYDSDTGSGEWTTP